MAIPKIRTIKHGRELLAELEDESKVRRKSGNSNATIEQRRLIQMKEIRLGINSLRARYKKGGWVEMDFGDLPPGAIFYTDVALSDDKANQKAFGRKIYGAKSSLQGKQRYTLMKSSGDVCFILSKGMDQGSMLSLSLTRAVICREEKKVLSGESGQRQSVVTLLNELDDEFGPEECNEFAVVGDMAEEVG